MFLLLSVSVSVIGDMSLMCIDVMDNLFKITDSEDSEIIILITKSACFPTGGAGYMYVFDELYKNLTK
jgi:hypothetical protein